MRTKGAVSSYSVDMTGDLEEVTPKCANEKNTTSEVDETDINQNDPAVVQFIASLVAHSAIREKCVEFGFQNLGFSVKGGSDVLSELTGEIKQGSLWGVMGPSGAGKSTFVNVLLGKIKQTSGSIHVNGIEGHMRKFKKLIGFVPQDDIILPELTVRENILHSARIRLEVSWTESQIQQHVNALISCLRLTHVQHSLVGDVSKRGISGGQRKRVSIALELAAAPKALVLDEPTSGLDATAALSIIRLLKALCHQGVTVMCIIHQPRAEIFQALDKLLLLSGGRQVYLGDRSRCVEYFETKGFTFPRHCNPADVIMDIISGHGSGYSHSGPSGPVRTLVQIIQDWERIQPGPTTVENQALAHNQEQVNLSAELNTYDQLRGASWSRQAYLCLLRGVKQQTRQTTSFILEISVGAVAGLLIGLSVYKIEGLLFQGVFLHPFELLSSATNYTLVPELGLLCSLAIGLAAAPPGVKAFGEESIYGLASIIAVITRREDGPLMSMIVSLIIGVFGGYGPPLSTVQSWHLQWFWYMCPGTWLSEAYFNEHTAPFSYLYDLEAAAAWTGYTIGRTNIDLCMLLVIGSVYRLIAYLALVVSDWKIPLQ
ncbi:hypothetical protein N7456_012161 [Penicillium angulare]|uniref:ABC transporter domain-containing protein n=1 Tax=Penicillium angulare TaxID=116970 RepID=A0A9W9K0S0_9EURO|nr:hypothetical protein N7456_012161 [Penicillium angulare]